MGSLIHRARKGILTAVPALLLVPAAQSRADVAYSWGNNNYGEVGDGTTTNRLAPVVVNTLSSAVTAVAAGRYHSLAIQNGSVYSWGYNDQGELGDGTSTTRLTPVPVITLGSGVTAIAGGEFHSIAIKNGGVYAWGYNVDGELGNGTTSFSSATPVAVSALSSGVTAISAGEYHNLAIKNGGVYVWGFNSNGQLGDGTTTTRLTPEALTGTLSSGVTAVAGGQIHSLAIQNGGVYAWGANFDGQLGDGTMTYRQSPVAVSTLSSGVTAIAAGVGHSLAIRSGYVYAWGDNTEGQLGDGMGSHNTPGQVDPTDLFNIIAIAAGAQSSYALSSDGSIWDWGANNIGQLGLGNTGAASTPQHLLPLSGYVFTSIASSNDADHASATLVAASTVNVAAGSIYHFTANPNTGILTQSLSSLTINATGKVIADAATNSANRQLLVDYGGLTLSGSTGNWMSLLDLGNNDLDLRSSTLATVTDQVRQGFAGGKWNGSGGIISSSAAADPKHLLAIGVIQNNQSGTSLYTATYPFDGITPGVQDILVKSTYYGDANLDGKVDGSDYSLIDNGYNTHLTGWYNGDFNYDGVVNGSDYTLIDNSFNAQGVRISAEVASPSAEIASAETAAVPEPAGLSLLGVSSVLSLRRRRATHGVIFR